MVNNNSVIHYSNLQNRCLFCLCSLNNHQKLPHRQIFGLCHYCVEEIEFLDKCCIKCAIPLPKDQLICPKCQINRPYFDRSVSAFLYQGFNIQLIKKIKTTYNLSLIHTLNSLLFNRLKEEKVAIDCITHAPMHWKKNLTRGNNHSYLIAKSLSTQARLPFIKDAITQIQPKSEQKNLNAVQRKNNMQGCFESRYNFKGLSLGIVDDVMTTGSTLNELSRIAKLSGAKKVYTLTLSRTPLDK